MIIHCLQADSIIKNTPPSCVLLSFDQGEPVAFESAHAWIKFLIDSTSAWLPAEKVRIELDVFESLSCMDVNDRGWFIFVLPASF